ncbi:MAG: sigma-70 family RNA polymerase sigma factor, partial [Gammaproteobacteria bacterium]|nr:sigma-70 family RNA polymerase sigma factor [Gammaproteobacteria bacterium]
MRKLEQLYRTHKDHLYNYIYRLCRDHARAEDVVQHTFMRIITDSGLDKVSNMRSYLFTIARNHLYDGWKKKREALY